MPLGSKAKYTAAQKRKAARIEQSYEHQGVPKDEAEARAWATVNKQSGGGEKAGGSGQRKAPQEKSQARSDSAKRAVASRDGHARNSGHHWRRRPSKACCRKRGPGPFRAAQACARIN